MAVRIASVRQLAYCNGMWNVAEREHEQTNKPRDIEELALNTQVLLSIYPSATLHEER